MKALLKRAGIVVAFSASVAFLYATPILLSRSWGMDFGVYWRVANAPVSMAYEHRSSLNFPYPPTMLFWIQPLRWIAELLAYCIFLAVSIFAFGLLCRRHLSSAPAMLAIIAPPCTYGLLVGQVSMLLATLLLWACATPRRWSGGCGLAVIASIKPQLVLLAPIALIFRKDWKALWAAAASGTLLFLLSTALFGIKPWLDWIGALDHFRSVVIRNGVLPVTITPASTAQLFGMPPLPFLLAGVGFGILVLTRMAHHPNPIVQAGGIACASLLAAPYAMIYDLTAIVPFLIWSLFRGRILSAAALSGGLNAMPLAISAFELFPLKTLPPVPRSTD